MPTRVAVVTGASSGFGLLTSLELARAGMSVVATMRNLGKRAYLDEAIAREKLGSSIDVCALDVTRFGEMPAVIDSIVRRHGRIDVLVNNAGFAMGGFAEDVSLEELRMQLETNFFGHVEVTKAVLPQMRRQRSGHVIMISSVAGRAGQPGISSYSASKFALEGWSEALRLEMRPLGIKVVLVEPGAFATDIWDRNVRIGKRAVTEESPNKERARRFAEYVKTNLAKRDPGEVARLIRRIADDPAPKLRYMIGGDAHAQTIFRSLVPWKVYEKVVAKKLGLI